SAANATHYIRIRAEYGGAEASPYVFLSTVSLIEAPTAVVFEAVRSSVIVVSAYAPGPAFSSMTAGMSGANVALGAGYAGWGSAGWSSFATPGPGRFAAAGAELDGRFYIVGGNAGSDLTTVDMFDPVVNAWFSRAGLLFPRNGMGAASVGGRLYAVAGYSGGDVTNVESYDPAANQWTARAPLPVAAHNQAVAAAAGKIYAMGGDPPTANNYEYDPDADTWTARLALPTARGAAAAAVLEGKIYLTAGFNSGFADTKRLDRYDPADNTWTPLADLPSVRNGHGSAALGGKVWVLGGMDPSYLSSVVRYDPATDAWTSESPMPTARRSMAVAAVGGRIYAVTGFNGGSLSTSERYDAGVTSSFTALTPNTFYTFRAKARNSLGVETGGSPTVSTYTLAVATSPNYGPTFTQAFLSSITVNWSSGTDSGGYNGPGASYLVQASTMATFIPVKASSQTAHIAATLEGLYANATHYFRVRAYNSANVTDYSWFVLGSTVTTIETPTTVYIDEVTTHSIVASAYAGSPAFSSMTVALSATNVAKDGVYAGWHGERWIGKAAITPARDGLAAGVAGGRVYALGGSNGSYFSTNEEYDPATNVWTARAGMLTPRNTLAVGAVAGRLYALGGENVTGLSVNEEYDPASNGWATKAILGTARFGLAAGVVAGKVYAVGGSNGSSLDTNEEYDPATNLWAAKTGMSVARHELTAAALGGKVYAMGGSNGSPLANTWATRASMPTARRGMTSGVVGRKVYALGGHNGTALKTNESYDPGADAWSTRAPMATARFNLAAGAINGKLYAFGGNSGSGSLAVNEEYDAGVASSFTALTPNKEYFFKARARNLLGTETPETAVVSTFTLAFATVPPAGQEVFVTIVSTEVAVMWASGTPAGGYNGLGASYMLEASTMPTFAPVAGSSLTFATSAVLSPLIANATTYFRVRAINNLGVPNDWFNLGSTVTTANPPLSAVSTFTMVGSSSMTVEWDANGNAAGTAYRVNLTTSLSFLGAGVIVTTAPYGTPSVTMTGLLANVTYYLVVNSVNRVGQISADFMAGSTVTMVETPTAVYFDQISTRGITASAYAAGAAFSSMTVGLSGTNISLGGNYQGWHGELWASRAAMTTARDGGAVASVGGRICVIAGNTGSPTNVNECYDPATNAWSGRASLPAFRYMSPGAAVVGGRIYVIGGADGGGTRVATNFEYDPETDAWATRASMTTARSHAGVDGLDGKVYVAGGAAPAATDVLEVYDPQTDVWAGKTAMLAPRGAHRAVGAFGKLYVVGGDEGSPVAKTEEYDPALNSWASKAPMATPRVDFGAALLGGKIYAVSGTNPGVIPSVEAYDPFANVWSTRAAIPTPRATPMTAAAGGRLYAIGGNNGPKLGTNESYDPGVASSFTALSPNTSYSFKAKARNSVGVETGETVEFSTYTLAVSTFPQAGEPVFAVVDASSVTVRWSSGTDAGGYNGAGATYLLQASSMASFIPVLTTSQTANPYATVAGLSVNATHYFRVRAYNSANVTDYSWLTLGSTVTAIESPSAVYFDELTTHSIMASAYAPTPAFSSAAVGGSGVNVARGGQYQGWRSPAWATMAALTPRYAMVAGAIQGRIYAAGGDNGSGPVATNAVYDPVTNLWTGRAAMLTARSYAAGGVVGGKLYVVGGTNGSNQNVNEEYDPLTDAWATKRPMPTVRQAPGGASVGGKLHVFGGHNGSFLTIHEAYDPATDTWAAKAVMTTERYRMGVAVVDGKIYAVAGGNAGSPSNNEEYDPATDVWTPRAVIPTFRSDLAAAGVGGKLLAIGGNNGSFLKTVQEFDPQNNAWTNRPDMPTARNAMPAVALGGKVYVVGGQNAGTLGDVERFDPGVASSFTALSPNTLYGFTAKARNSIGVETPETAVFSTYTLAAATMPQAGSDLFSEVFETSVTVNWSSGTDAGGYNGPGATYLVQASSMATFLPVAGSSLTANVFATVAGLSANATHYIRLKAYNAANVTDYSWFTLGSRAITASAYAPGPAFSSMTVRLSGTNISLGGNYQGWHGGRWTAKTGITTAREQLGLAAVNGKLYALGGFSAGYLAANEEYDPAANAWQARSNMPTSRKSAAVGVLKGKVYVVGGYNGTYLSVNEEYDPASNSWSGRAALPTAREGPGAGVALGKLYVVGGRNASVSLNANEAYDADADAWTARASMTTARNNLAAGVVSGKLYAAGGAVVGGGNLAVNEEYDPGADSWTGRAAMATPRSSLAAAVVGGKLLALGGENGSPVAANEEYDPGANVWTQRPAMPTARHGLAAAALNGRVYALGGVAGVTLAANEEYDPGVASSFTALTPNTQYFFKAKARNLVGVETPESAIFSTYTLAVATLPNGGTPLFGEVHAASITVNWSSGTDAGGYNGEGASYLLQASTMASYQPVAASSRTANLFAALEGLSANATHYFRVQAYNSANVTDYSWTTLGSTLTAIEAPTSVVFLGVSSNSLVAVATAAGTGFSNLSLGTSAVNISLGGVFQGWVVGSSVTVSSGLVPNTPYSFRAKARNLHGVETAETAAVSTYTLAAATVPQGGATPFAPVFATSMTVSWSSGTDAGGYNGPGASYLVEASTMASFDPVAGSSLTFATSAVVGSLTANATHYLRVRPSNSGGMAADWFNLGSTVTLANPPLSAASTYTMVGLTSMTVTWDANSNAAGTRYDVVFTTYFPFNNVVTVSTTPYGTPSATATGLLVNATYYPLVFSFNRAGVSSVETPLGSTATRIETPSTVLVTVVTSHSVVAVASSPVGAFSNLDQSSSAVNIARDAVYQDWVAGSSVTVSSGLVPNTLYSFKAKARNLRAVETDETTAVSTYTLAFATVPAAGAVPFTMVFESSVAVQWASGTAAGGFNGPGATYRVEASTTPSFLTVHASSTTAFATATVSGLTWRNTTFYFRVTAFNAVGANDGAWTVLGATVTPVEAPTSVEFLSVSSDAVVSVATAAGTGFSNLALGTSAVNIALNAVYQGWVVGSSVTVSSGLVPNTLYSFKARARGVAGLETAESGLVSTRTLAAVPAPGAPGVYAAFVTSASVQWGANNNPSPATEYRVHASTASDFNAGASSSVVAWVTNVSTSVTGLIPYSTWYFRVQARNADGRESDYAALGSTVPLLFRLRPIEGSAADTRDVVWGDFDRDGDLDLAAAVYNGGVDFVLRDDGAGPVTYVPVTGTTGDSLGVAWGDYDGDGDLDLAIANDVGQNEVIGRNDGGTFTAVTLSGTAGNSSAVAWGDFDRDGDLDLAIANQGTQDEVVLRNDGGGVFFKITVAGSGRDSKGVAWGDFDGDGDLDLLVANSGGQNETLLRYDGGTSFAVVDLGGTGGNTRSVAAADFDGDGDLDFAAANELNDDYVARNDGTGTFSRTDFPGTDGYSHKAVWGDYDGDGDLDLAVSNYNGAEKYLARNTAGAFSTITVFGSAGAGWGLAWGDSDQDGLLDLAVGEVGTDAYLLINKGGVVNSSPMAPGAPAYNLAYGVSGTSLTVSWPPSFDAETSTGVLSYALVAATAPMTLSGDGRRILSPASFLVSWNYGSPLFGANTRPQSALRLDLGGLSAANLKSDATYYFRLQTVDAGLARSSWSVESSTFVYKDLPPQGRTLAQVNASSIAVSFVGVGATKYFVEASTTDFVGGVSVSSLTLSSGVISLAPEGLTPNTTYYLRMGGLWQRTTSYAPTAPPSTATLANAPATAVTTFTAVYLSSFNVAWSSNSNPAPTQYRLEASTASDWSGLGDILSAWFTGTSTSAVGLTPNATTYVRVQARNHSGLETDWTALGSTVTGAAKPAPPAGSSFTAVGQSSVSLAWGLGTNPADTQFQVRASTASDFSGLDAFSAWLAAQTTTLSGLTADTTYHWRVTARNHSGLESEARDFGAQATAPYDPAASSATFHRLGSSSVTVQWLANGNPAMTSYEAQLSTAGGFGGDVRSSGWLAFLSTTVWGLTGDSTYSPPPRSAPVR
ncbi:MAG: Kelch repeat-containing protein, partial [Elusimicrobia bacterium]